ncbi:MAG: hypothetical protein A3H27_03680 [Acidobacteria bacterium RIFCSPLOWO2_02_FULL_59_13]|nr:MAG: hypothetical protein A3H27_03680 [Acidobacteria bacterium RIFCSPLOWO2_02_FULL_59_13]
MLVLKLILKRLHTVLLDRLLFRLRYFVGFLLFALMLWFLKVTIGWLIDTKYWDGLKSDQFMTFEERGQPNRSVITDSAK